MLEDILAGGWLRIARNTQQDVVSEVTSSETTTPHIHSVDKKEPGEKSSRRAIFFFSRETSGPRRPVAELDH